MSFFAGGGWRNTATISQATATTNNVSASRQNSVDESPIPGSLTGERKPLLRSHTDPLVQLAAQNASQASLGQAPDPNAPRRFTFRGVARALPYFLRAAPVAETTPQEAERTEVASPPQSVIDLPSTAPTPAPAPAPAPVLAPTPEEHPTPAQQATAPPEESISDHTESPVSNESAESGEERVFSGRKSRSSSTGSTIVTEEPHSLSQGVEEILSDIKKSAGPIEDYSSLQNRIQELERDNEEKAARLRLAEESAAKTKVELQRIHASEMESHRREHQNELDVIKRESKEGKERIGGLEKDLELLRQEMAMRDEVVQDRDSQVQALTSARDRLQDMVQQFENTVASKDGVISELRSLNASLEEEKRLLEKYESEMEEEFLKSKEESEQSVASLKAEHEHKMATATNKITVLQAELASSNTMVTQLRASLDTTSRDVDDLSKALEDRNITIIHLQQDVTDLQGVKQMLEERVEDQVTQTKIVEETAAKERADLCKTHTAAIDAERRIIRNLQSSLESLQLEMGATETQVANLTREKNGLVEKAGKLEERIKSREQQIEGLKTDMARSNSAVRDLEEKLKTARDEARKEKTAFATQSTQLRRQLDDAQKVSAERNERIQQLEGTKDDLTNSLRRMQTYVNEKDITIQDLGKNNAMLEETRENLEGRLVDMERTLADARETAQSTLDRTVAQHERDITQARTRIQELQDELSSFITTAQELHGALESSREEARKAQQLAEERAGDIHRRQQRIASLQDTIRSLEVKNDETLAQMKVKEQAAREEKATIMHHHSSELQTQRATMESLKEKLERNLSEKEERLGSLVNEKGLLQEEVTTMKARSQKVEADLTSVHATLRDVTERNKLSIERLEEERAKVEEEADSLRRRSEELQQELRERTEEIAQLKMTTFQKVGVAMSNAFGGFWTLLGTSNAAANRAGSV